MKILKRKRTNIKEKLLYNVARTYVKRVMGEVLNPIKENIAEEGTLNLVNEELEKAKIILTKVNYLVIQKTGSMPTKRIDKSTPYLEFLWHKQNTYSYLIYLLEETKDAIEGKSTNSFSAELLQEARSKKLADICK